MKVFLGNSLFRMAPYSIQPPSGAFGPLGINHLKVMILRVRSNNLLKMGFFIIDFVSCFFTGFAH
jgi:hypothetical protein